MDTFALASFAGILAVLTLAVLVRVPAFRAWVGRLAVAALERLTPEPEVDQDALDLYEALRRERLLRDVTRLRRLVATDEHMSAVRQIGNRMAYDRLLQDLSELRDVAAPPVALAFDRAATWTAYDPDPWPTAARLAPDRQYRPTVETLELGRRR